eukprot:364654-Chlamydomonas_euryale.AAC.11
MRCPPITKTATGLGGEFEAAFAEPAPSAAAADADTEDASAGGAVGSTASTSAPLSDVCPVSGIVEPWVKEKMPDAVAAAAPDAAAALAANADADAVTAAERVPRLQDQLDRRLPHRRHRRCCLRPPPAAAAAWEQRRHPERVRCCATPRLPRAAAAFSSGPFRCKLQLCRLLVDPARASLCVVCTPPVSP